MQLLVDIGNTRIKAALFLEDQLQELKIFTDTASLTSWASQQAVHAHLLSAVGLPEAALARLRKELPGKAFLLEPALPVPIGNAYQSPQTLGADRLAAAVAGARLAKGKPALVFDAGTCLTVEYVDAEGVYQGGAIAPGLQMRFRAMHEFTQRLPGLPVPAEKLPELIGKTTQGAMESGVVHGMLAEIEGTIDRYRQLAPEVQVFLGGGDTKFFESKINRRIFAIPEIVLIGLNEILRYNVSNQ